MHMDKHTHTCHTFMNAGNKRKPKQTLHILLIVLVYLCILEIPQRYKSILVSQVPNEFKFLLCVGAFWKQCIFFALAL